MRKFFLCFSESPNFTIKFTATFPIQNFYSVVSINLWFGLLCNFMDDPLKSWDWIGNIKRKSLTLMMDIWLTENSWVLKYLEKRPKYKVTLARTVFY